MEAVRPVRHNTMLAGHGLEYEGSRRYEADGITWDPSGWGSARCRCGALSEPGISTEAAQQWHREHKDSLR